MPPLRTSNIRAHVHWKEPTVYAGEEIECSITFKNIARPPGIGKEEQEPSTPFSPIGGGGGGGGQSRRASIVQSAHSRKGSVAQVWPAPLPRSPSVVSAKGAAPIRGHRPTLSLNVVNAPGKVATPTSAPQRDATPTSAGWSAKGHARSLSIMSLGSEPANDGPPPLTAQPPVNKAVRVHARSASLQHPLKAMGQLPSGLTMASPRQPSPLYETTTPPELPSGRPMTLRPARRRHGTASADHTPQLARQSSLRREPGQDTHSHNLSNFKFPLTSPGERPSGIQLDAGTRSVRTPSTMHSGQKRSHSPRPFDGYAASTNTHNPLTRVMSETSAEDTPRTSSDFYSMSNRSDETLTSELPFQQQLGRLPKLMHSRRPSRSPHSVATGPETLMMAYAQTIGHFTLDGSLVNTAPFEEVKRKGVQGGGGVVGVERTKRSSGLFGALGWGNIGESIGGLLGGDEMSSMAQMKASAGSKTIPLLSTPQSLLFVDLRLLPGESKSYSYRFRLPRGLPPTHRGRAIKVSYHLSLGVQRPEGQTVQHVETSFRVLGSYDARGDMLGHNLMSPYVLLEDAALTALIAPGPMSPYGFPRTTAVYDPGKKRTAKQGLEDFLRYTERLKESPKDANGGLLLPNSPTSPISNTASRQNSLADQPPANIREAIDLAILRSNLANSSDKTLESQSANRFNIARSGQPVAVLTILRPAYRLGEAVTGTIDFTAPLRTSELPSHVSSYSVNLELESAETVDPSLALRSSHSINRVTRKVFASARKNTLFARQIGFSLTIPSGAAPSFETTGVSLAWRLRVEFTSQRQARGLGIEGDGWDTDLLEELASDERGTTFIAKERLAADTFEIGVPLKVFGAVGIDSFPTESELMVV